MFHLKKQLLLAWFLSVIATAQQARPQSQASVKKDEQKSNCRCCSIDRFYAPWMKDLPPPPIRKFLGNATLTTSTKNPKAQLYINQGINCIHGFWEFEAYRYFLAAAKEDPDCAMAYWGICLSLPGKVNEAQAERIAALERAVELSKTATPREQLYISSIKKLIELGSDAALTDLKKITELDPTDLNALGLLAYWNTKGYDHEGKAKPRTLESIKLIEKGLKLNPKHLGLIHYYIHIIEPGPDFLKAMPYIENLAKLGKDISHLVHMPGHIYFLAGDYAKACNAFSQCYAVEKAYFSKEKVTPVDIPNYSHNLFFWSKAEAERGNYTEALRIAKLLKDTVFLAKKAKRRNTTTNQNQHLAATAEAFVHLRFRNYTAAIGALPFDRVNTKSALGQYLNFIKNYCLIHQEIRGKGDWNTVYELTEKLEQIYLDFKQAKKDEPLGYRENTYSLKIINTLREAAKIYLFNTDKTAKLDLSMVEFLLKTESKLPYFEPPLLHCPMAEEIGWLCLRNKQHKKAETYFKLALKNRPHSYHAYQGLLEIATAQKNLEKFKIYTQLIRQHSLQP